MYSMTYIASFLNYVRFAVVCTWLTVSATRWKQRKCQMSLIAME